MLKKTLAAVTTLVAGAFLTNLILNRVRSES